MRRSAEDGAGGGRTLIRRAASGARRALLALNLVGISLSALRSPLSAQERLDRGRFTFVFSSRDRQLATTLAERAVASDSFPGLPRPAQKISIAIALDHRQFRDLVGDVAPEWGAAVAFPDSRRIVMQGQGGAGDAGNPVDVLRHELAHLALHEFLGNKPPRWFDEGYASFAAGEWGRSQVLETNVALALRGMPTLDELEESFRGGETSAQSAYALAFSAVEHLHRLGGDRGLTLFFGYWRTMRMDRAMRAAYGMTLAGFETAWRTQTRSRYGGLALLSNVALAGLLLLFILLPFYLARRRRDKARLEKMREADAVAEQAERSAIDDLISGS